MMNNVFAKSEEYKYLVQEYKQTVGRNIDAAWGYNSNDFPFLRDF